MVYPAGILITKINLDTFGAVYDVATVDLAAALADAATLHALIAPGRHGTESVLLQLTVVFIFILHEAENGPKVVQSRCASSTRSLGQTLTPADLFKSVSQVCRRFTAG